ncbi:MAG TPA: DNA polymerase I [Verrucomicrobiota bacterium]|nr:MAG: DNA polymerase I [Verrucomicrobia bacterium ADurb.Bin063]HOC49835.1 DNA polymerase I [Verrucomicrobiota bacterium]HPW91291.1 DNA polymerase I [Verrucomicrobiota bacterium]HQB72034.1 DNA polymerase I [Verrucomicrobiota bacterium]
MAKRLFLLDGMALVYRAHFAFIARPVLTSQGVNTSALYGFTQTLLNILGGWEPTHLGVAFDTAAPTHRHREFAAYKATRQEMPEDLSAALPHVRRMLEAFNIPALALDGFEADDLIGTLVRRAEREGFQSYMVTSDKDFGQLVSAHNFIFKPARGGDGAEILGLAEIQARWGVSRAEQVVEVLALMGDASDNIPGVPGIGEKTAVKLIAQYGTLENLLAHVGELTGRVRQALEAHPEQARQSRRLATIRCDAPLELELDALRVRPRNEEKLRELLAEFEFNALGRRLFGEEFRAGRARGSVPAGAGGARGRAGEQLVLLGEPEAAAAKPKPGAAARPGLKTLAEVPHQYHLAATAAERAQLIRKLQGLDSFCLDIETTSLDPKAARLVGLAFSFAAHSGYYVPLPPAPRAAPVLEEFRPVLESERIEKVGHNLKFDLSVLKWQGISVGGKLFDTLIAHSLLEPEMRHGMDHLAEVYLDYTPIPIGRLLGDSGAARAGLADVPVAQVAEYAAEDADVTWQLRAVLEPLLKARGQERVFYEVEAPLIPVLVDMEYEGIKVDAAALAEFAAQLAGEMGAAEKAIYRLAGTPFNLNSPRQLGQILFDVLKLGAAPRKTRTGQYATDEQTLQALAADHEIVRRLLEYRAAAKLKSTYADALPEAIWPGTGRVHTTYHQVMTATGRLSSQNPNVQNIPIRTERGQEIRKAFVPRGPEYRLLAADYSQIELRILAALSRETVMLEAFRSGADIHTATAARVFGIPPGEVTPEMRRKAKMVNFGIAYGISAFGLSQRLGISRAEAGTIIAQYFQQFPGIRRYRDETIARARERGYVETVTGRRRYLRDIRSANDTARAAAERNAINAPIQGSAADMIKLAMVAIHRELVRRGLRSRMLLQVHDELVFDLYLPEREEVRRLVGEIMTTALPLEVAMAVEMGEGENWLAAH